MSGKSVVKFTRYSENAVTPVKGTPGSAGLDLYPAETCLIPANGKGVVSTDIGIELPANTCGIIMSRSGLCLNKSITVFSGVVDSDYTGSIKLIIFNYGKEDFLVEKGMRIAQLIIQNIVDPYLIEVSELECTLRGSRGFGSTGIYNFGSPSL